MNTKSDGEIIGKAPVTAPAKSSITLSAMLYQCKNIRLEHKVAQLDVYTPTDMRAPGATWGLFALECAMDEIAYELGVDPLELRLKNYAEKDQRQNKAFSSKELRECYRQGAEKFGWARRKPEPRSMREGDHLIGWGMATGIWESNQMVAGAKAVLTIDGKLKVSSATSDIGTGTYTIMTQIAAETLGLPLENVTFELGVEVEATATPDMQKQSQYSRNTHSAIFAEVKVDQDLGVIHVTRIVSAVAAGRILNPKTARSQVMGGIVWGIGMALEEESVMDQSFGRFINHNLAEYHVPVNADAHEIDVIFVEENDPIINPLGVKGLGEIGVVGVAAAIANAVFHATGKRVRELPITLDKLM